MAIEFYVMYNIVTKSVKLNVYNCKFSNDYICNSIICRNEFRAFK